MCVCVYQRAEAAAVAGSLGRLAVRPSRRGLGHAAAARAFYSGPIEDVRFPKLGH